MENQKKAIADHLRGGNAITPLDALKLFGCFRLSARIFDLRRDGMKIHGRTLSNPEGKHFKQYYL